MTDPIADHINALVDHFGSGEAVIQAVMNAQKLESAALPVASEIDIVFDGPPSPAGARFIEVESPPGTGIRFGRWVKRDDGYTALRFAFPVPQEVPSPPAQEPPVLQHPAPSKLDALVAESTILTRLRDVWKDDCDRDDEGQGCCCRYCCSYCWQDYLDALAVALGPPSPPAAS